MTEPVVYSATILEHFRHPRNSGEIDDADGRAEAHNPLCGDRIRISLKLSEGRIRDIRFKAEACAICTASASLLSEHIRGREVTAVAELDDASLIGFLDADIPAERRRCATLPLEALRAAAEATPGHNHVNPE